MQTEQTLPARVLAPIALISAAVVVVAVIAFSLGGSGDEGDGDGRGGAQGQEQAVDAAPEEKYYVVQPGDSFSTIAEEQGIPQEQLQELNPDLDPQALAPGQRVKLR